MLESETDSMKKRNVSKLSCSETMVMGVQQQRLTMFEVQKPFNKSNPKWKKLIDSISYFLAKDVRPFDTVNDSGFRHLLNAF